MAFYLLSPSDTASRGQYFEAFQINTDRMALRWVVGLRRRRQRQLSDVSRAAFSADRYVRLGLGKTHL